MELVTDKKITNICISSWFLNSIHGIDAILKILYFYLIHNKKLHSFDNINSFLLMVSSIILYAYYKDTVKDEMNFY